MSDVLFPKALTFFSEDHATNWALDWLRKRGFVSFTASGHDWLTPGQLARRVGLRSSTLHYRLAHKDCPLTGRQEGPTGRLVKIALTPELVQWVMRPLTPGERCDLAERRVA